MPRRRKKPKLEETAGQGDPPPPPVYMLVSHGSVRPAYSVFQVLRRRQRRPGPPPRAPQVQAEQVFRPREIQARRVDRRRWRLLDRELLRRGDHHLRHRDTCGDHGTRARVDQAHPRPADRRGKDLRDYALARYPSVNGRERPVNFWLWFEVLDLSESKVVGGCLTGCQWTTLPRPPFFPWGLNPYQYIRPNMLNFAVRSYASVGSHILVSVVGQPATYAFDTETEQWTTVDDKNALPFIHGPVPHGPELFLGVSRATRAITALTEWEN